jgi:hypothetical protein
MSLNRNIGAFIKSYTGITPTNGVAGTGFSGGAITGAAIDRTAAGLPLSMTVAVTAASNLTAAKTNTVHTVIQHSADNSAWATYTQPNGVQPADLVQSATGANVGIQETDVDLSLANRYVRITVTPTLSAVGTDTAVVAAVITTAGAAELPA